VLCQHAWVDDDASVRAIRATSFGAIADHYDRFRPSPPIEAAEWFVPHEAGRIVDMGAGTGGFSRVLAQLVDGVVAVELDLRMAAVAAARSPGVAVVNGRAESLPLCAASFDAVVVSSAWHWMDPSRAVPEVGRVLRPGGVFGVIWNGPDRSVDWVGDLFQGGSDRHRRHREFTIPPGHGFDEPEQRIIRYSLRRSKAQLIGLVATYSRFASLSESERRDAVRRITELVERYPLWRGQTGIELPMAAQCWRVTRLAGPGTAR
jgi:SAM-dependent methyltransferase